MVKRPKNLPRAGSFWHKKHAKYSQGRLKKEIITIEEGLWLLIGLAFGWIAGKGASVLLLLIPIALFAVWAYEHFYAKKYGTRTIHGKIAK